MFSRISRKTKSLWVFRRYKITSTGGHSSKVSPPKSSGSPFANSLTFQLFLIVGAMGAGYSLGKSIVSEKPPADLFPPGSTTKLAELARTAQYGDYDKFRRCILRILESQGYEIDQKEGKNEKLYDDPFMSKDVAQIMNTVDQVQDLFLGKKIGDLDQKRFVFYPESTKQVSGILKDCQEFHIPVFTSSQEVEGLPYRLELDLSRLKAENGRYSPASEMCLDGSALQMFFSGAGIQCNDTAGRYLWNKVDKSRISSLTAVLPDGTVITVTPEDPTFGFLSSLDGVSGVVTEATLEDKPEEESLVVLGLHSADKLSKAFQELKGRFGDVVVAAVSGKSKTLEDVYGGSSVFVVAKVLKKAYSKAGKKLTESNDDWEVLTDIDNAKSLQSYYSCSPQIIKAAKKDGEICSFFSVVPDISQGGSVTYCSTTQFKETQLQDTIETKDRLKDLQRRLKFAVDPAQVLNPNMALRVNK